MGKFNLNDDVLQNAIALRNICQDLVKVHNSAMMLEHEYKMSMLAKRRFCGSLSDVLNEEFEDVAALKKKVARELNFFAKESETESELLE